MKISKEIERKIAKRNELNKEIQSYFKIFDDLDGMTTLDATITNEPQGEYQGDNEWCDQQRVPWAEDEYQGDYYWMTETGRYIRIPFWV